MKILSQNKFENFKGFISQGMKPVFLVTLENGQSIKATDDHRFLMSDEEWVEVQDLQIGMKTFDGQTVLSIVQLDELEEVYDAYNVENTHSFYTNGFIARNCSLLYIDECAFIQNWEDFSASVLPVLSSGKSTKLIITSTPKGLNHFYEYYIGAKSGINGFKLIEVKWSDVPSRDEAWKEETLQTLNYNMDRFDQEYCVTGDSLITIKFENGLEKDISIKELYDMFQEAE